MEIVKQKKERIKKMNREKFIEIFEGQIQRCKEVLFAKNKEYGTADVKEGEFLHNFYRAGAMLGQKPATALRGMLVKHLVSINDFIDKIERAQPVDAYLAMEKITDAINYLFLLATVLKEEPLLITDEERRADVVDGKLRPYAFKKKNG